MDPDPDNELDIVVDAENDPEVDKVLLIEVVSVVVNESPTVNVVLAVDDHDTLAEDERVVLTELVAVVDGVVYSHSR